MSCCPGFVYELTSSLERRGELCHRWKELTPQHESFGLCVSVLSVLRDAESELTMHC